MSNNTSERSGTKGISEGAVLAKNSAGDEVGGPRYVEKDGFEEKSLGEVGTWGSEPIGGKIYPKPERTTQDQRSDQESQNRCKIF